MKKNIIYFSPLTNTPTGGVKVIHKHCEIINAIGGQSQVYYHLKYDNKVDWFEHSAPIKEDSVFICENDFVILPESLIYDNWEQLKDLGVDYGIFVQNGYLLHKGISDDKILQCYEAAKFIICISEDSKNCIFTFFPEFANKVIRTTYSIDSNIFKPSDIKEKIITYMPRKMMDHSEILIPFLKRRLPDDWKIKEIDNMTEREVALTLSKSSIFLAFSGFEGLPVPPVEAALSGNFVIGYTGNGGREYWNRPMFESIENGDITYFLKAVISKVAEIDHLGIAFDTKHINLLRSYFSKEIEIKMLVEMIQLIESLD